MPARMRIAGGGRKDRRFIGNKQTQVTCAQKRARIFAVRRRSPSKIRTDWRMLISPALILPAGFFERFAFLLGQAGFTFAADLFQDRVYLFSKVPLSFVRIVNL